MKKAQFFGRFSSFSIFLQSKASVKVDLVWNICGITCWQRKIKVLGEKSAPAPLCPPQIPHGLVRSRTQPSAVRIRRLTSRDTVQPLQKKKKVDVICRQMLPDFLKRTVLLKVRRLRSYVVLVRVTCRWRRVWRFGGMILTRKNWSTRGKTHPCANFYGINFTWIGMWSNTDRRSERKRVSVLFQCSLICEKALIFESFTGFSLSSFWLQWHVDGDEYRSLV